MSNERGPRVVVGVDGSPESAWALRHAMAEGAARGAEVRVIAAAPPTQGPGWFDRTGRSAEERMRVAVEVAARRLADEVWGTLPAPARRVPMWFDGRVGHPVAVLVDAARDADLLVVGRGRRSALRSAVLGSTSLGCVLHAPCPVTVVPAPARPVESAEQAGAGALAPARDPRRARRVRSPTATPS